MLMLTKELDAIACVVPGQLYHLPKINIRSRLTFHHIKVVLSSLFLINISDVSII